MAEEIKRTITKRNAQVKVIKDLVKKGKVISDEAKDNELTVNKCRELAILMKNIRIRKGHIDKLNESIIEEIEEEEITKEIEMASELDIIIDTEISLFESELEKINMKDEKGEEINSRLKISNNLEDSSLSSSVLSSVGVQRERSCKVRLPELSVKNFKGDPILWPQFIDTFRNAIHENKNLTDIEKFTYLKSYLNGDAEKCVEGLSLTAENYELGLKILQERFGNKQLIISKHMNVLLSIEKISSSFHIRDLRALYDKVTVNLRALSSYGINSEQFGPMLIPVILEKLPNEIKLEVSRKMSTNEWDLEKLMDVLKAEIEARETCNVSKNNFNRISEKGFENDRQLKGFTTEQLVVGNSGRFSSRCAFCNQEHFSDKCNVVSNIDARKNFVRNNKLCYKCLGSSHIIKKCKSKSKCFKCKSVFHHTALCQQCNEFSNGIASHLKTYQEKSQMNHSMVSLNNQSVLLQTINILVSDDRNTNFVKVKVLFDSGSMKTYITQKLVDLLSLKPICKQEMYVNSFGNNSGTLMNTYAYNLCLKSKDGSNFYIKGSAVPNICAPMGDQQAIEIAKTQFSFVDNFIDNREDYVGDEIDILIGGDYYWSFIGDSIRLNNKLVMLSSKFGYILSGPIENNVSSCDNQIQSTNLSSTKIIQESVRDMISFSEYDKWDDKIDRFWELDSLGILPNEESVYDKFEADIKFVNNRYEVKLPFKENHPPIENNYNNSLRRLKSLKINLAKTPGMMKAYDDVISQQMKDGIVEKVSDNEKEPLPGSVTYLPHRPVISENKSTKLRVVYDASAKSNGYSLNQCLYKGPCLTPLIFHALMKFRLHHIAITSDIEKAYLQISVFPPHRDFLRFMWFDDIEKDNPEIIKMRFLRVIFGATSSQYLLNSVVRKHINRYSEEDPDFVLKLRDALYVDDLTSGVNTISEGVEFYEKCKKRFTEGNFNLRKWRTNNEELKQIMIQKEGSYPKNFEKVLGLIWDDKEDLLIINLENIKGNIEYDEITKRIILAILAGFFDPLGWIQPLIIQMKIIFQEVCKLQLNWDEEVPAVLAKKWKDTLAAIKKLGKLSVPRCYCYVDVDNPVKYVVIIGFSDASLQAYGCCVYFKYVKENNDVKISLVAAKSRVAPLKNKLTIPRLELMGALLLSRLIDSVMKCFENDLQFQRICCFTDSMICLSWIQALNKEFKMFVQNRVIEIREKTNPSDWFYCPTEQNPADIITRLNIENMTNKLWFEGPSFILDDFNMKSESSTDISSIEYEEEYTSELKPIETNIALINSSKELTGLTNIININNYSNFSKLIRVTAYVLRFIAKLKKETLGGSLPYCTTEELDNSRLMWIRENQKILVQSDNYPLMEKQLNIVTDDQGVLRAQGRMKHACLPFDAKSPVILSKEHYLCQLIVDYCHLKVYHNGIKQTIVEFRSHYYISKIRQYVKKRLNLCIVCKKINTRPLHYPSQSDLPKLRFDNSKPFSSVGLDYLGPLSVLPVFPPGDKMHKIHVVLYTCAATRGVVLDIVENLSSSTFINSMRRFISERGVPSLVVSDNGSAFIAAETQAFVSERFIRWQFNLEATPWWGGIFESLVKSVKNCLKKMLGLKRINYLELLTVLKEIQIVLNNRPLCEPVDEDVDFLTPNSILFGRRLESFNDRITIDDVSEETPVTYSKRFKYLNSSIEYFWKIWRQEYLISLRDVHARLNKARLNKFNKGSKLEVNEVVIVEDEKMPRHRWKLGRVLELIIGKDGILRGARVLIGKTRSVIGRPLNKLCRLELKAKFDDYKFKDSTDIHENVENSNNCPENSRDHINNCSNSEILPISVEDSRSQRNAARNSELRIRNYYMSSNN